MRILYLFALCVASAISPSAAGQSGKPANVQPAAQNAAAANSPAQAASQPDGTARNANPQNAKTNPPALGQSAPVLSQAELEHFLSHLQDAKPGKKYSWPQVPFDRGIYAARNALTGTSGCYAIQSYNFSQGASPRLESITTCTTVERPLGRLVQKPDSRGQQGQSNQQTQSNQQAKEKDQR